MLLTAGSRVGPYEITDAIGAGGMGEVYRGRDSRLKRDVAITSAIRPRYGIEAFLETRAILES